MYEKNKPESNKSRISSDFKVANLQDQDSDILKLQIYKKKTQIKVAILPKTNKQGNVL